MIDFDLLEERRLLLAENDRLRSDLASARKALEPFARNTKALRLIDALGHIERDHLAEAKAVYDQIAH